MIKDIVHIKMIVILFIFFVSIGQAYAEDWSFPAPKGAQVQWVSDETNLNGIKLKGRRFTSTQSVEEIINFYRDLWEQKIAQTEFGEWILLSHKNEELLYTVQVKKGNDGGSTGLLGVSDIAESMKIENRKELAKNFPKLHGSQVINDMKMNDPGKDGKLIYLTNKLSVSSNVNYYKNHYKNNDWTVTVDKSLGFSAPHTLVFAKGKDRINMIIARKDGQTNVVANIVNKKLLPW
ncbi:MAG: hypothetical protein HQL46_08470 [Gammaproteobacteria bacterium]|nr:hypothetical protein [Gammaproteobacteria bacterium]